MFYFSQGNLLHAKTEALVNAVNTAGAMGKGIALEFKKQFPEIYRIYRSACEVGDIKVGKVFSVKVDNVSDPKWIINFPTKTHWKNPSKMDWIVAGLWDLKAELIEKNISSVSIPALGCGLGGLSWPDVKDHILQILKPLKDVEIFIYEPK